MALIELLSENEAQEQKDMDIDEVIESTLYEYNPDSPYSRARLHNPPLIKASNEFGEEVLEGGHGPIDRDLYEYVKVAAAQASGCEYCASHHRKYLKEAANLSGEELMAVTSQEYDEIDELGRAIMEFTDQVVRDPHQVTEADIDDLRDVGFDESDLIQLLHAIIYAQVSHTVTNTLDITRDDYPN